MSKTVDIEALRPFNRSTAGDLCEIGDVFPVNEGRADELERLGLAKRATAKLVVQAPDNQAAPTPLNKAAPKPKSKA